MGYNTSCYWCFLREIVVRSLLKPHLAIGIKRSYAKQLFIVKLLQNINIFIICFTKYEQKFQIYLEFNMEDVFLFEEVLMVPDGGERRYQPRRNLFEYDTDSQFERRTRFTKEGVQRLAARLEPYLDHETNRGLPVSVVDQVFLSWSIFNGRGRGGKLSYRAPPRCKLIRVFSLPEGPSSICWACH